MADNVSTFTENQEVTSDMLNDIVNDLGAAEFSYFTEGEPYAVDKLNEITKALVSKGVLMDEGKCAVTYSNGKITVATGTIVFGSGAKMRFTSPRTFSAYSSNPTYVFALHDTTTNEINLWKRSSEPTEDDYTVILACVSADGVVTDLRPFCKAKCNLNVANQTETVTSPTFRISSETDGTVVATIPLDFNGYHAIYVNSFDKGFIALPDAEESDKFYVPKYRYITFKKSAAGIDIYGYTVERPDSGASFSVNITLY